MIERQIHLSSGGGAALQGYDGLLRFGYTRNRGIYALRVEADGEWQGMTLRAFWHLPDGNAAPSTLVVDGLVEVPALITAVPGEGRITFEGTDGTRTLTSADVCYCVAENSGTEDSTLPQPGTPAWQALLDRLKAAVESGAFRGEKGEPGPQGEPGAAGPTGPKGEPGSVLLPPVLPAARCPARPPAPLPAFRHFPASGSISVLPHPAPRVHRLRSFCLPEAAARMWMPARNSAG